MPQLGRKSLFLFPFQWCLTHKLAGGEGGGWWGIVSLNKQLALKLFKVKIVTSSEQTAGLILTNHSCRINCYLQQITGMLHPYIYLSTQMQTFKNVQYESYHWPAGRRRGRKPCHITQLVNDGLPSDDFVVSQVLRGDDPSASSDIPNALHSQRSVVEALGMIPYFLEGFRVLWVSDIVSELSEVSSLIEQ